MEKPFVYITRKLPEEAIQLLKEKYVIDMWEKEDIPVPRDVLIQKAKQADALLTVLTERVDEEVFSVAKRLKVVANMAVGFDNIDVEAANRYGVAVCNTPDVLTASTADLAFALLLAVSRRIVEADHFVKSGGWKGWAPFLLAGADVHHKTIGIVGMGKIGEEVAKRALGFEMTVLYHNRSRKPEAEKQLGAIYCKTLHELLERSDFVVCLTPLTPETKGMFSREEFRKMKKHAIFVNIGRGPVVDEKALYEALKEGEIKGAGLDVFEKEPIDADHPLLSLDQFVGLPHIGSATKETRCGMIRLCCKNIHAVLQNEDPPYLVNREWLEKKG